MMVLVIGGSGSGKSAYAEQEAVRLSERDSCRRYYLATMEVFDDEGRRKVEKHRNMRAGKGFITIERPCDIAGALEEAEPGDKIVLLECISNLTANEMFSGAEPVSAETAAEKIIQGIQRIKDQASHLVVVSGNVSEDGIVYEKTVMEYIRAMGMINRRLGSMAHRAVEVVAGIPVVIKQEGDGRCG